jgi:hypothetical protein
MIQTGFRFNFNGANVSLLDAALIYAGEGFSIIPLHFLNHAGACTCGKTDCPSPGKHPLTRHGLRDASNDPDQIEKWWDQFPHANIGVCTGAASNGLVVIDFDPRHGGSEDGLNLPETLKSNTGNGHHLWFVTEDQIRNSAGKLGQGIDVRGTGGYIVAPPSKHVSGRTYTFDNQLAIAELPEGFFDKFEKPPISTGPFDDNIVLSGTSAIPDIFPQGQRNEMLFSIAGKMRRNGFSSDEIESALLTANLKRCVPPLSDKEVRQIAWSIGRYIPVETIEAKVIESIPGPSVQQAPSPQTVPDINPDADYDPFAWDDTEPLLGAITAEQLAMTVFAEPEMVLQGLFKGDWGLMVGIGSVGKTTLMHNICVCLASGRPFLPIVPAGQKPRRILYLDFESNPWRLQKQIGTLREWLTSSENDLLDKNLHFAIEPQTAGNPWRMTDRQSLLNVAKYIQEQKIDLLLIDTISQAAALNDENSNSEVQNKVVTPMRRLVRHCDVAVLLMHHEGKAKKGSGENHTQYRARGASALMDGARYQITMVADDDERRDPVKVINSKNKGAGFNPVLMSLDNESRWFSVIGELSPSITLGQSIIDTLDAQAVEMTVDEVCTLIPGAVKGSITNKLSELARMGKIIRTKHGSYRSNSAVSGVNGTP